MLILDKHQIFGHITEQHVNEAAFLWMLRSQAVNQAHHNVGSIAKLEQRITNHLKGLLLSPGKAWEHALEAAQFNEGGESFVLAVLAFFSGEKHKVQTALELAMESEAPRKGLVSALGWLPQELVYPWLNPWIKNDNPLLRYLSLATCSVRRLDPQKYLSLLFKDPSSTENIALLCRMLRLVGELKRHDLAPALAQALSHSSPDVAFWAHWSTLLLGDDSMVKGMGVYALHPGPYQARAIEITFRSLSHAQAGEWINTLNNDPEQTQQTTLALATLGEANGIPWLLARMEEPAHAKIAGEAFCMITGVDLERAGLTKKSSVTDATEEADEELSGIEGYDSVPYPDAEKVSQYWQQIRHQFTVGQRYFQGHAINMDSIKATLMHGRQRQRHGAALEYALMDRANTFPNVKALVYEGDWR